MFGRRRPGGATLRVRDSDAEEPLGENPWRRSRVHEHGDCNSLPRRVPHDRSVADGRAVVAPDDVVSDERRGAAGIDAHNAEAVVAPGIEACHLGE